MLIRLPAVGFLIYFLSNLTLYESILISAYPNKLVHSRQAAPSRQYERLLTQALFCLCAVSGFLLKITTSLDNVESANYPPLLHPYNHIICLFSTILSTSTGSHPHSNL